VGYEVASVTEDDVSRGQMGPSGPANLCKRRTLRAIGWIAIRPTKAVRRPFVENSIDGFNPSKDDLPDRVDFIYTAGKSKILESLIMGEPDTLL